MSEHDAPTDQTADVVVTDPDDFNRQQRFKEIHDARQRVTDYVAKVEDRVVDKVDKDHTPGTAPAYVHEQLAFRVSLYIMELLPLLEKKDGDDLYMSDHFPESSPVDDLRHYAEYSGILRDTTDTDGGERTPAVPVITSLRVFQVANRAYANLGMDLEIAENEGDAGFDYSDILESGPPGGDAPQLEADGTGTEGGGSE